MGLVQAIRGKVWSLSAAAGFARYLSNWYPVWQAYRAARPLPPLRFRGGGVLHHRPEDDPVALYRELFIARAYLAGGFYRPRPTDRVIDAGANIGTFALLLNWLAPGIRVDCFEPFPTTRAQLEQNVAANRLHETTVVHPAAVSGADGTVTLFLSARSLDTSAVAQPGGTPYECPSVSLAGAIAAAGGGPIDLLKVDIEGAEADAFRAASEADLAPVRRAVVEYHGAIAPGCREVVTAALRRAGFGHIEDVPDRDRPDGQLGLVRAAR